MRAQGDFQGADIADSTINRTLAALKRMFHLATECTPPKVQFVPHIPTLKENNVRTGFVETEARMRRCVGAFCLRAPHGSSQTTPGSREKTSR